MRAAEAARPLRGPLPSTPDQPEFTVLGFASKLGRGELAAAAACFGAEGCFLTPDGTAVCGRVDIAAILQQLIARRVEIEIGQLVIREAGDVAFAAGSWTIRSDGPEASRIAQTCDPTLILNRVESKWKIAVLAPWGTGR